MIRVARSCAGRGAFLALPWMIAAMPMGPVGAAQKSAPAYAACMAKANSTLDMQQCQTAGLAQANARLEVAYAKALAALPADQQAKLQQAEAQWFTFRRSDCGVFYGNETGTLATVQGGSCMIDRTEDRVKNLQDFISAK
jgi:uncharacterized protein YecT (DUF1311 family)